MKWLFKSEPDVFSIDDLTALPTKITAWDGVRNYQARNFMQQMKVGDLGFFYHSNAKPPGIAGIVKVVALAHPDKTAFDETSLYYDPKSTIAQPRWWCVDVAFVKKFERLISLDEIKAIPGLEKMILLNQGRLSVQPVTEDEWPIILSHI